MEHEIDHARSWRTPGRAARVLIAGAFMLLCLALVTRYQLLSRFALLPGDRYDVVISTTILEHWFHVFMGQANWSQVSYFFPYTRTIAQTDAYFLIGVAYFPFRVLGMDPFLAQEFANLALRAIGFAGAYLLCRRQLGFRFYWALLAAGLLTMSNGLTSHSSRIQFVTMALAPWMGMLMWRALASLLAGDARAFRKWGVLAGLLFGAWCLTCFYIAWFFAFFFTVLALVLLVRAGPEGRALLWLRIKAHPGSVLLVLAGAALAMFPFAYAFVPKSREVGVRAYESVLSNTIPLQDVLQVGRDNFMFGRLYNDFLAVVTPGYAPFGEYANTGIALILFFLFACGVVQLWREARMRRRHVLWPALAIATLLTWLLALRVGGHSGWFLVYHLFPGAKALNVVAAYQIFLALPVVLIAVRFLSTQRLGLPVALLVSGLLMGEELNRPYLNLERHAERARLALPQAPPAQCKAFYVSGWRDQQHIGGFPEGINTAYAHNVAAMLIAQQVGIPTVNGIASFSPRDWNFGEPNRADYDDRVFAYARRHRVDGLCKLALDSKQWSVVDPAAVAAGADVDHAYFKKTAWPGRIEGEQGLSFIEPWGVWSTGEKVVFDFSQALPAGFELRLRAHAFASNAGKDFVARVGGQSRRFQLGTGDEDRVLEFNNPSAARTLTIEVPSPVSPQELGMGKDDRRLGIGFAEIRVVPL